MSLIEEKFGACLYLNINKKIIVIQGYFKDDLLNISKNVNFIQKKYKEIKGKLKYEGFSYDFSHYIIFIVINY